MSTKLFAFTSLLALASALPRVTLTERRAQNTECWQTNPGTSFYRCSNGYVGCFVSDPCSLPPLTTLPTPSSTYTSTPTPPPAQVYEITKPRSYNIYVLSEAQHNVEDKVGHVDLNKPAGSSITTTNAMVFDNVPAGAKNCRLNWRSTAPDGDNVFTVSGSGAAFSRQLLGFPSGDEIVSFDGLKKYQDPKAEWSQSLDFTGWPDIPGSHIGPSLNCASQVALELKGSGEPLEQENRIFLTLTETNGFYMTYEM